MPIALGKLARLKRLLNTTDTALDVELRGYLLAATDMARHGGLAGRDLTRQKNLVEVHPLAAEVRVLTQRLELAHFPVQSVTEVVDQGVQSTTADFDAAAAAGGALVEGTDFRVVLNRGGLVRYHAAWPFDQGDSVRVTYTAGFADPADLEATVNAADATQLDVSAGMAEPNGVAGAELWYAGGSLTAFADGPHAVYVHADAGVATLASLAGTSFPDPTATPHTPVALVTVSGGAGAIVDVADRRPWPIPDRALSEACVRQAHLLYQTRDTAGVQRVDAGSGGYTPTGEPIEPTYLAACRALRRIWI